MKLPTFRSLRPALAGVALLIAAPACAGYIEPSGEVVWVHVGPPPPRHEIIVASPGPEFLWIEGYYRWDGAVYAWVPGRWERRPQPRSVWVRGRWNRGRRGWYWVEGHWDDRR